MQKLLIVDDSSTMRKIIVRLLERAQVAVEEIFEAADGVHALELLREHPDMQLVLSDVFMPEMDGLEFVRRLREDRDKEELPVLMVTTVGTEELMGKAMGHGANGYVEKPFTAESVRAALEPYIEPDSAS